MALISFNDWMFAESKKWEKCPYPKNTEYCREYKRYLNGEISVVPNPEDFGEKARPALGHWDGKRGGETPTRKNMARQKAREGKGKYKWRSRDYE